MSAGWIMIGIAVLMPGAWVVVQAATVNSIDAFNRWAGWANILALPVATLGTAIVLFDRARARSGVTPAEGGASQSSAAAVPPWMSREPDEILVERTDLMTRLRTYLVDLDDGTVGITGIHGAGGFGKTTLAAQASMLPELRNRFPGGLLWVTVGQSMNGPELTHAINDLTEQLTGTRPALATPEQAGYRLGVELDNLPPTLLILDDVWTPKQLRPFLNGGGRCKRLITTRVPKLLPASAYRIKVDEMSRSEAATLLNRGVTGVPAPQTTVLLELTGRWPLLVALVNGVLRWRTEHGEPVDAAVATVVTQLSVDGPTSIDVTVLAQRERAVDLTVRASLELLSASDQRRFVELGIFPEGVPVPDSVTDLLWSRIGASSSAQAESLRGAMADLSLVQRQPDGVLLHDVLRAYLRHRLTPAASSQVNVEFIAAARRLVETAAPEEVPFPWWRLPPQQHYLWRYLCYHLDEGGIRDELAATATNLGFIGAKIQCLGVAAVESDLDRVPGEYSGVLRARLSTSAHLLAPLTPAASFRDLLVSRLAGITALADAVAEYAADSTDRARTVLKWPLPDLGPSSLARVIVGGQGWLESCALSPSGDWIAAGSHEGTIGIWERSTGTALAQLTGHASQVTALAITPDSAWIVSAGEDGTVRIWDAARRRLVHTMRLHEGQVNDCTVSPESTRVASVGNDGLLCVVDINSGQPIFSYRMDNESLRCCVFLSEDVVLSASQYGKVVSHDVTTDKSTRIITDPAAVVEALAVGPGCSWVALTGVDDEIRVFPLAATSDEPVKLTGHDGFVTSLVADGNRIISGGADGTIRIWDIHTGRSVSVVQAHTSWVNCCVISTDRRWLISAGTDGMIRAWDMPLLAHEVVEGHVDWVNTCSIAPNGAELASGGNDHTVRFWKTDDARPAGLWRAPSKVWSCAFGPSSDWLAIVSVGQPYLLRRAAGSWSAESLLGENDPGSAFHRCFVAPDGRLVAFVGLYGDVLIRAVENSGENIAHCRRDGSIRAAQFLADGESIVFGGSAGDLLVWRFRSGAPTVLAPGSVGINALTLFPDRSHLACLTASDVRIFDTHTLRLVDTATFGVGGVNSGAISDDSRWLATTCNTGELRVFALGTFENVASMRVDGNLFECGWRPRSLDIYAAGRRGVYAFSFQPTPTSGSARPV